VNSCIKSGLRYLRLLRPAWGATIRDRWQEVASIPQAVRLVPSTARVFSNTGWKTLSDYADFRGRKLYMRQTHPATGPTPFAFVEFVEGTPPFTQFQEEVLFQRLGVSHLICRNVGGAASMSKLLAARRLGLPVYMVARPPLPAYMPVVDSIADALAWEADT
jgi:precorrin-6A/cobalt-precorrin-6A reductase